MWCVFVLKILQQVHCVVLSSFPEQPYPRCAGKGRAVWGCLRQPLPKCQVEATSLKVGGLTSLAAVILAPTNNEVTKYCVKKELALQHCL